jgi:signal transduction histidine kinase
MRHVDADQVVFPVLPIGTFVLAVGTDPGTAAETALLAVAALALAVMPIRRTPVTVPLVVLGVLGAVWQGRLEAGLFLLSVLVVALTLKGPLSRATAGWVAASMAVPVVVRLFGPGASDFSLGIWLLGIGFPAVLGWTLRRQTDVAAELADARLALAESAVAEERRRIARDVHDLVGHGLAAALVQIASARHVLRRDAEAADHALALAEKAGRSSMQELRSTLATLNDGEVDTASLPTAADIAALAEEARADGLPVTLHLVGDPARLDGVVGVTLYRIAQEALANARRHAPRAETVVELDSTGDRARLSVLSHGATYSAPQRPTFGLRGMEERAAAVQGTVTAGTSSDGWLVEARLPTEATG